MTLDTLVKAATAVINRFIEDKDFYTYLSRELSKNDIKMAPDTVKQKLRGSPNNVPIEVENLVFESFEAIQDGKGLYDENFLPFDRRETPRIIGEIQSLGQEMCDWYQFKSRTVLAKYIADKLSVNYNTVMALLKGEKERRASKDIGIIYAFIEQNVSRAKSNYGSKEWPQEIKPSTYFMQEREPLAFVVDRIADTLFGPNKGAKHYITERLGSFKKLKQLEELGEKITKAFGFSTKTHLYYYSRNLAGIERKGRVKKLPKGVKEPLPVHRKIYAVMLGFDYAKQRGLEDKVLSRINQKYRQVPKSEYMKMINLLKKGGIEDDYVLATILSRLFGINVDAGDNYVKGKSMYMTRDRFVKLEDFQKSQPYFFYFKMGQKETNEDGLKRFREKYKGGVLVLVYKGSKEEFDGELAEYLRQEVRIKHGGAFFFSRNKSVKAAQGYRQLKELLTDPIYTALAVAHK